MNAHAQQRYRQYKVKDKAATEQRTIARYMIIVMWIIFLALLYYGFNEVLQQQYNPNQNINSNIATDANAVVNLKRNKHGHYVASGMINNQPVVFMLDTGASDISVPANIAKQLGLKRGTSQTYQTANGPIISYLTRLDSVSLGPITLHDLRASINPNVDNDEILLGMSFLKHLEFTQRGDTLTLRK